MCYCHKDGSFVGQRCPDSDIQADDTLSPLLEVQVTWTAAE